MKSKKEKYDNYLNEIRAAKEKEKPSTEKQKRNKSHSNLITLEVPSDTRKTVKRIDYLPELRELRGGSTIRNQDRILQRLDRSDLTKQEKIDMIKL